jgi:hypothetical protein
VQRLTDILTGNYPPADKAPGEQSPDLG